MQRGQVWVASFKPFRGREVGKARPCVILQADWLTLESPGTVIVLPLTSQLWAGADALRVEIPPRGRLRKPCWVMIDKVQVLDVGRFSEGPLAQLDQPEMTLIGQKLQVILGMV
ncbi:MAG: type II toxin-antitoxin system PemK/MazF family toxin [Wenzhouxiangella sp.]|jgi:mRNA interferase MazF|nr:type II toxin-antitoxin system PemK/MazF family toxin [Wenzhouxiangella sp.]